nr:response regulator [uncultured Flavobacterium sp.]
MNILLVDDHPMTVEGFMNALLQVNISKEKANFTKLHNCKDGYDTITTNSKAFDLAILDQGLPGYAEQCIESGSDLALLIREHQPNCKIIMITAHIEVIIIYDILQKVNPDGLIIKNDIRPDNLQFIVTEVLQGNQYHSPMVKACMQEMLKKELLFDDFNRQILYYLSKGFKLKELDGVVCLGDSAIQKRVIQMKNAFNVTDNTGLLKEAMKQGFI